VVEFRRRGLDDLWQVGGKLGDSVAAGRRKGLKKHPLLFSEADVRGWFFPPDCRANSFGSSSADGAGSTLGQFFPWCCQRLRRCYIRGN